MATLAFETDSDTEQLLQVFAATLSEKDLRRFAAIEARRRGYGGSRISQKCLDVQRKFLTMITRCGQVVLSFPMGSMIALPTGGISTSGFLAI